MRVSLALVVLCCFASAARAQDKCAVDRDHVRVMLQDLETAPMYAARATGLGQVVAEEAAKVQGFDVLSAEEVRSVLNQEADKALLGCSGNSCLAELAEALDAELVLSGRVDAAPDGGALVALTVLNARAVVVVNRVSMIWRGADTELPEVVRAAAQMLLLEAEQRPRGSIQILGLPADARVYVDGEDRTRDHKDGRVAGLEVGPHEIRAESTDMEPAIAHAVVKAGQQTAVTLTLEPVAVATWIWIAGGAGAVVLGGAAAIAIAYAVGQSDVVVSASVPAIGVNDGESIRKGAGAR